VKPGQVDLRFGTCTTADDDARIAGKRHQKIAGITHAARKDNGSRPIRRRHRIGWNDAEHQTVRSKRPLGSHPGCGASAPAHERNAESRQGVACFGCEIERARSGLSAAEYTYLRSTTGATHKWYEGSGSVAARDSGRVPGTAVPRRLADLCDLALYLTVRCNCSLGDWHIADLRFLIVWPIDVEPELDVTRTERKQSLWRHTDSLVVLAHKPATEQIDTVSRR